MGRLTRDPELRRTQSGTPVASFALAVDRGFVSKATNERQVDFIDCVAWQGTGEFISKWFTKGQMIAVNGRLQIRDWKDKDGNNRRSAEVVVENAYFTESKKSRDGAPGASDYSGSRSSSGGDYNSGGGTQSGYAAQSGYTTPVTGSDFAELDDVDDGDLPF
jgi:single-strand DNA-binding protein